MHTAAPDLSSIRARLADLTARADARRARDAQADLEPTPTTAAAELPLRDNGAAWKAAQGRDWLAEAREDVDRPLPTPKARVRSEVAPEYLAEVEAAAAEEPAPPVSKVGGDSTEAPAVDAREGVGAPAGNPEGHEPARETPRAPRAAVKLPQAISRGGWRERWARIEAGILRASFAPQPPGLDPFAGVLARAGPGPPG